MLYTGSDACLIEYSNKNWQLSLQVLHSDVKWDGKDMKSLSANVAQKMTQQRGWIGEQAMFRYSNLSPYYRELYKHAA